MTWFADLTPYGYDANASGLAVGWLDLEHPFTTGDIEPHFRREAFLTLLFWAVQHRAVNRYRGYHNCELCGHPGSGEPRGSWRGAMTRLGDAQVEVTDSDGQLLIAPTLVFHYVADHLYAPPEEFVSAVIAGTFRADPRPVGQLHSAGPPENLREREPSLGAMLDRLISDAVGASAADVAQATELTVAASTRSVQTTVERLPSLSLALRVPGRRAAWCEWAPTVVGTERAAAELLGDPAMLDAILEAVTA